MKNAIACTLILAATGWLPAQQTAEQQLFKEQVLPMLISRCGECHNPKQRKAELDLTTLAGLRNGGESGPLLVLEKPADSLLLEMVVSGQMPPKGKEPLTDQEIKLLRRWANSSNPLAETVETDRVSQWQVLPILQLRCTVCHGTRRQEGELDLRSRDSILHGGKSGPGIVPGDPAASLLLKRIHAEEMPPRRELVKYSIKPMEVAELELLTRWIEQGAVADPVSAPLTADGRDPLVNDQDRQFWSFQPARRASLPAVQSAQTLYTPIDHFIVAGLAAKDLDLSPPTDRHSLLRRAYLGLLGVPPGPAEVEQFLADSAPAAYERLLDRLLASPRYGERWGGLWLDVAGYADSEGVQHSDNIRPFVYRYRDYVIQSWNADKPYSRFVMEQVAGDELGDYTDPDNVTSEVHDNLVATGFLRLSPDATYFGITNFVPDRLEIIDDMLEVFSSSVLGLTVRCARCHSHKFDPIPQRDYYRLAAIFKGAVDENDWLKPVRQSGQPGSDDRYLGAVATSERSHWQEHETALDEQIEAQQQLIVAAEMELVAAEQQRRIDNLPEPLRADLERLLTTPDDKRDVVLKYLAEKFLESLKVTRDQLLEQDEEFKKRHDGAQAQIERLKQQKTPPPLIRALWDRGSPSPTYILRRGNYLTPGRQVEPGVPSVLTENGTQVAIEPPWPESPGTGRRLALARWLVEPDQPLTARVIVNRIWHHHFDRGIVATLDDFGLAGARPTHPELLDWLAVELVESGWSIKHVQRQIMSSAVYRQSSEVSELTEQRDPDNLLLSRMPLRRMDAETLRDSLLSLSGRLRMEPFGPADDVEARADGLVVSLPTNGTWRRSVFVLQRRTQPVTILGNFDRPQMNPNCVQRMNSNVAPQALHLLNNKMIHELATSFAERVRQEAGEERTEQVRHAYMLALARGPSPEEQQLADNYLDQLEQSWREEKPDQADEASRRAMENFCHTVMNLAAFIYID
jgi:cytochrome c553